MNFLSADWLSCIVRHMTSLFTFNAGHFLHLSLSSGYSPFLPTWIAKLIPTSGPLPGMHLPMPFAWLTPSHHHNLISEAPHSELTTNFPPSHFLSEHLKIFTELSAIRKFLLFSIELLYIPLL